MDVLYFYSQDLAALLRMTTISYYLTGSGIFTLSNFTLTLEAGHEARLWNMEPQAESTHGNHQMVNTEIRLIIFYAAKDGEVLYSQHKQDWEQIVA